MLYYREKAIGDLSVSIKYEKELKERIKHRIKVLREDNIQQSK